MKPAPLNEIPLATFAGALKTRFRVSAGASSGIEMELVEVSEGRPPGGTRRGAAYQNFSLTFIATQSQPWPQGTYGFEHGDLGRFDLFIVPVAQDRTQVHYQAVFNRLVSTDGTENSRRVSSNELA